MDIQKSFMILLITMAGLHTSMPAHSANKRQLSQELLDLLENHPLGTAGFTLPNSNRLQLIPQDFVNNPLTQDKIRLGKLLFHETGVSTESPSDDRRQTYSCATCHHAAAGFKPGIVQGIGDGGVGIRQRGSTRRLGRGLDPNANDGDPLKPDLQPIASPTVLNTAYQPVTLWNGAFGNSGTDLNASVAGADLAGPATILANQFGLPGVETQVLAGTKVHRLRFDFGSDLQTNSTYQSLYAKVFPDGNTGYIPSGSAVTPEALGAAKAIAAYERTILANRAPFQKWLKGNRTAMTSKQIKGALLFFGKANCVSCHTGPALSSLPDASADEMFYNVGFKDLDPEHNRVHGSIPEEVKKGRGSYTGDPSENYKFKIPQLYNLKDTRVLGHGASFKTVRQVVKYKNRGQPQSAHTDNLAAGFIDLNLSGKEVGDLTVFVRDALYDPNLFRYQPRSLPTGNCIIAADIKSVIDQRCW